MNHILTRLKELERTQPTRVHVFYSDGSKVECSALKAFDLAVNCPENISFDAIGNEAMTTLLNAVRDAVGVNE